MKKLRASRSVGVTAIALAIGIAYVVVWLSPLREAIGRQHPGMASVFSPPWFNFDATYTQGDFLDFRIGMSRNQLLQVLNDRYPRAVLIGGCGDPDPRKSRPFEVPIADGENYRKVAHQDILCLWVADQRLSVNFFMKAESVYRIDVALVRNEVI